MPTEVGLHGGKVLPSTRKDVNGGGKKKSKMMMNGKDNHNNHGGINVNVNVNALGPEVKARILLFIACLWPLWVLALFGASSAGRQPINEASAAAGGAQVSPAAVVAGGGGGANTNNGRFNLRSVLDRVDVVGYGPTHPRIAVVVVGEDADLIQATVESLYSNTDLNRIFVVCAVLDGHAQDAGLTRALHNIDDGSVAHWHGLRPDIHRPGGRKEGEDDDPHSRKIHIMFNPFKKGVTASRMDAVEFVQLLQAKHEEAGLKNADEDLILLLMEAGTKFQTSKWLSGVTSALIVPPPILGLKNEEVAMKLANAVSFRSEAHGFRTSFNEKFAPLVTEATASDINLSSGQSYPTPALNGAAVALRLGTFVNLPAQDPSLMDPWGANLDLSLNLWLCADGIDIVEDVDVTIPADNSLMTPLEPEEAARFAAVWMDDIFQQKFLQAYSSQITRLDWETKVAKVKQSDTIPKDLAKRCRSFDWYAQEVNSDLAKVLEQGVWESHHKDMEEKKMVKMVENVDMKMRQVEQVPPSPLKANAEEVPQAEAHKDPPQVEQHDESDAIPNLARNDKKKPSKPLRQENLEIVQKAKPMDISKTDVSGGHKEHPHMGAKDADGNWGYVHNERALRGSPPQWQFDESKAKTACSKRDNNYRMMKERILVDMEYDNKMKDSLHRDKIFCLVYTIEPGHVKIPHIRQTWGPKCDGFMVGSNKTDPSIGAVNIPHEGPEEYNNIWQKVRSMWSYIYDNYYDTYDWFHIGGDDLFLIVENLRYYLESEEIRTAANGGIFLPDGTESVQTPLLLGRRFAYQGNRDEVFDSGGSGYTMNKAALKLLVVEGFPNYFPHAHTFSEDTMVAKLFRKMGVLPYDTKDDDGGERYMPFLPGHHYGYHLPPGDPLQSKDWYAKYSINIKEGPEHCSPRSVAFHYVKDDMMERLFMLAYDMCPKE